MALIHTIDHPVVSGVRLGRVNRKGQYNLITSCIVYRLGNTTIDTGPPREWQHLKRFLEGQSVRQVALTHHHEDHSGNGHQLQKQFGSTIYSHSNNHELLAKGLKLSPIRRATFGNVKPFTPSSLPALIESDCGKRLQPIHMPGHTNDLVCYLEPDEGWLFTGDLYVSSKLKYMTVAEDVGNWISSLTAALDLDFDTLFCSHRAVVNNGKAVLAEKLAFFQEMKENVYTLWQRGDSPKQIRKRLLGNEDIMSLMSGLHMSKQKIIDSCLDDLQRQ